MGDDDPLPESLRAFGTFDDLLTSTQTKLVSIIHSALREIRTEHEAEIEALRSEFAASPKPLDLVLGRTEMINTAALSKARKSVAYSSETSFEPSSAPRGTRKQSMFSPDSGAGSKQRKSHFAPIVAVPSFESQRRSTEDMPIGYHMSQSRDHTSVSGFSEEGETSSSSMNIASIWGTRRSQCKNKAASRDRHRAEQYEIDIFAHTSYRGHHAEGSRRSGWLQNVTNPSSSFNTAWRLTAIFLLSFDCLTVPMTVFEVPDDFVVMRIMLYVVFLFWTLDLPLSFMRGYINKAGDLETRPKKVIINYLTSHFAQDLVLLVVEWVNFILVVSAQQTSGFRQTSIMRVLKFMRLLKITKASVLLAFLYRWLGSDLVLQMVSVPKVAVFILLAQHLIACGWHWIQGEPGQWQESYAIALHWSCTQMGFGWSNDMPTTMGERIYAICVAAICLACLTVLIGAIVTEMNRMQAMLKTQRDQEARMRAFMRSQRISWALRNRIWTFLHKSRQHKKYISQRSVDLIRTLPGAITLELEAETWIPVLTTHPFFGTYAVSGVSSYAMRRLFEEHAVGEVPVVVEHELFLPWTPAQHMYFIAAGTLYYRAARGGGGARNSGRNSARGSINLLFSTHDGTEVRSAKVVTAKENIAKKITDRLKLRLLGDNHQHQPSLRKSVITSRVVEVHPGDWLCEPALWLRWHHLGIAAAKTDCELVTLEAERFQTIMHQELPEAQTYAKLFVKYAKDNDMLFDDVFFDYEVLQDMAKQVFEPPLVFQIFNCHPVSFGARSEWQPTDRKHWHLVWTSPFKEGHTFSTSAMISTLTKDMKHDIILLFQTIFTQNLPGAVHVNLSKEETELHDLRALFLKRLVLCLAVCRLRFTHERNGSTTRMWPYPLASALCHGSRILVHLSDVPWKSFVNLLLFGDEGAWPWEDNRPPAPFYTRRAASHGIRMDSNSSQLTETKVGGVAALSNNHLGMDLPLGGLGNPAPHTSHGQVYVGPSGVPFRKGWMKHDHEYIKEVQHGHLYMRWEEVGDSSAVSLAPCQGQEVTPEYRRSGSTSSVRNSDRSQTQGGGFTWSSNLECWLPPDVAGGGESWAALPPVEMTEEMKGVLREKHEEKAAGRLHKLWTLDKELSLERHVEGDVRCHGLLVQLTITLVDNGEEKVLVQRSASAQLDGKDSSAGPWRMDEVCRPTLICPRHEAWKMTVSRFLKNVMGLNDAGVRCLIGACRGSEDPYMYHCKPFGTVCHHHVTACPEGVDIVYDVLHLTAALPTEERQLFEPILCQGLVTKERADIGGFGKFDVPYEEEVPCVDGTISREWQWCSRRALETQGLSLKRPEDSYRLTLTQEVKNVNALLLGIESSAPMKKDFFGNTHSVDAVSKSTSAFGKRKWRDYRNGGQEVPADLGGMRIFVDTAKFRQLREVIRTFPLSKPSDGINPSVQQKELETFQQLLQSSDLEAGDILEERLGMNRDAEMTEFFESTGERSECM